MPKLMLMRHANSSPNAGRIADRDRPLSARGRREARTMAAVIVADGKPDRILCSPARRAQETLAALLPHLAGRSTVAIKQALYDRAGDYRDVIGEHGGNARRLLVIGHNPAVQATALALTGSGDETLRRDLAAVFPTGALAVIEVDLGWADIRARSGQLAAFRRPA